MTLKIARHKTALHRKGLSRPVRLALEDGVLQSDDSFFDYGCGRGTDVRLVAERGIRSDGWDPNYAADRDRHPADVVNLGYVINVIEDEIERAESLTSSWRLAQRALVVSAQLESDARADRAVPFGDGVVTGSGTFQRYFRQDELRAWIVETIGTEPLAAAPGIFYIFRDAALEESVRASRFRRPASARAPRKSDELFDNFDHLFDLLMQFLEEHGRVPDLSELPDPGEFSSALGSPKKAFQVLRRVTGSERWKQIEAERREDLLSYLALSRFGRRPKLSSLSLPLQRDIKSHFGSYKKGCLLGDELLFSLGNDERRAQAIDSATVGKRMPSALYAHSSAVAALPPVLRVYEGCAAAFVGMVTDANVIKLSRMKAQVSYLSYPKFDEEGHPELVYSLSVNLLERRVRVRFYDDSRNPPILHRKEELVGSEYPKRDLFKDLTQAEEELGLYGDSSTIGTRSGWAEALNRANVEIVGHRIVALDSSRTGAS